MNVSCFQSYYVSQLSDRCQNVECTLVSVDSIDCFGPSLHKFNHVNEGANVALSFFVLLLAKFLVIKISLGEAVQTEHPRSTNAGKISLQICVLVSICTGTSRL